jgi:hypothetical protein
MFSTTPLTLKKPNERFRFEYVKEKGLLFVQLNQVLNRDDKTLAQFFAEVFAVAGKASRRCSGPR